MVLGFLPSPWSTGLTGPCREVAGVDRFDNLAAHSSAFKCVTRFCVNSWTSLFGEFFYYKGDNFYVACCFLRHQQLLMQDYTYVVK